MSQINRRLVFLYVIGDDVRHWNPVVSIQSRFDTNSRYSSSRFNTEYYTIYKWPNEPSKTYLLERTQTSVVNKTNSYLREPPHVPKPPTQWEHANETKFSLSLFKENTAFYKYIWDFFYNSNAYYACYAYD